MKKEIKKWAVIWTKKGKYLYGVSQKDIIINVEPRYAIKFDIRKNKKIGRPAIRYTSTYAIFPTRQEAEACREENPDWTVVPITITYEI